MKRQLYPIMKTDWCVTIGKHRKFKGRKVWHVRYRYCTSKKEVDAFIKDKTGYIQIFKLSYEFKNTINKENKNAKRS